MMKIDYETQIACEPEALFPWVAQPEKAMLWMKSVKNGTIIQETPGMVGTTFRERVEEGGDGLEMEGVITEYIPNKKIAFHLESKIHQLDVRYAIEAQAGKSKLTINTVIHWKFPMNMISIIMGRKIKAGILDQLQSEVEALKELSEGK